MTVIVAVPRVALPLASVAVKVTVVAPTGKKAGASFVTVGLGSTVSVAPAAARKAAMTGSVAGIPVSEVAFAWLGGGTTSRGGVVSTTVTWKDALAVLPCASVALHVTVVTPSGNFVPLAGAHATGTGPSRLSTAVGAV